jgi:hypothetical protein
MKYGHFSYNACFHNASCYNAIDLFEKAVSITRVLFGYNAIEIKQIKKFNISSIFS